MASGKPIEIPIKIDADDAGKGADKITDALEDIQDSLKDTEKAGDKTADALKDDMSDAAKKIDRDLTQALEEVQDKAKATGKTVGREIKDGTDKAGQGMDELKSESASTAKEAAASFGSIEDAADALQEVAANAFVGFGPAGAAAGLIAAAGIGLAISALTDQADKINENKEKMLDLAKTIRDNGGVLTEADYIKNMEDYGYAIQDTKEFWEIFQEDAISGFEKLRKIADETGLSTKNVFKGAFGDLKESKSALRDVEERIQGIKDKRDALYNSTGQTLSVVDADELKALEEHKGLIQDNITVQEQAIRTAKDQRAAIEGTTQAYKEDMDVIEKHTDSVKDSISSNLDAIEAQAAVTASFKENGATLDENTQKGRDNIRATLESASAIEDQANASLAAGESTDVVTAKFQKQRDTLVAQVMPAFGNSRAKAEAYIDTLLKTPNAVNTAVVVNGIPQAEAKVRAFTSVGRHIQVDFRTGNTYAVDNYIAGMQRGVTVPVNFAARGKPAIG